MSIQAVLRGIEDKVLRPGLPEFRVGDTVRVNVKIVEGDKERVQTFEGVVIRIHRGGARASFTVRKISYGVGVERIFPLHSPRIESIEVAQRGRVHQARLFYLRQRSGKAARIQAMERVQTEAPPKEAPQEAKE